jgi:hypothetical protein
VAPFLPQSSVAAVFDAFHENYSVNIVEIILSMILMSKVTSQQKLALLYEALKNFEESLDASKQKLILPFFILVILFA